MKCLVMFTIRITFVISINTANNFLPNLPFGEYKVYTKAFIRCHMKDHSLQTDLYLNKISKNVSELRGNVTLKKTFDDSFSFVINIAVKDSIGGWKDNFYSLRFTKLCTNGKRFLDGAAWQMVQNNFGYRGYCPIPPGVYISKGLDITSFIAKMNIPKQFFYGTYKSKVEIFEKNGQQASCYQVIFDVKRPWETAD